MLERTIVTDIYYNANIDLAKQKLNVENAKSSLDAHLSSGQPQGMQRHLLSAALANNVEAEERLYNETLQDLGDAALEMLYELKEGNHMVGTEIDVELNDGSFYKIFYQSEYKIDYLG